MKFMLSAILIVFVAGTVCGQTSETETLKQQLAEQGRQIEELQQKLSRLETVLGESDALRRRGVIDVSLILDDRDAVIV